MFALTAAAAAVERLFEGQVREEVCCIQRYASTPQPREAIVLKAIVILIVLIVSTSIHAQAPKSAWEGVYQPPKSAWAGWWLSAAKEPVEETKHLSTANERLGWRLSTADECLEKSECLSASKERVD